MASCMKEGGLKEPPLCVFIRAASDHEEIRRRDQRLGGKRRELDGCTFSAPIGLVIQSVGLAAVDHVIVLDLGAHHEGGLTQASRLGWT